MNRRRRILAGLLPVVLLVSCSASAESTLAGPDPVIESTATPSIMPAPSITAAPSATSTAAPAVSAEWPEQRPADFAASFDEDGGMAPWAQEITVGGDRAVYEVWMNRITYVFDHQPTAERLDLLYDELRLGRFGDYDVIPFDEDEQPLDEGGRAWSASFGEFHHRFGDRNGTIDSPDTGFSPLVMLQAFVDQDQVPEATDRLTLVFESQSSPPDGLRITFDLGEAAFAMGEERWADEFVISWSGGPREVPVTVHAGPLGGRELVSEAVVEFVAGGRVRVVVDPDGQATVAAG